MDDIRDMEARAKARARERARLDTAYQDTIVCPWCGYAVAEGDLFEFDEGDQDCVECGKPMRVTISVPAPTYTTERVPVIPPFHQPGCGILGCNCQQKEVKPFQEVREDLAAELARKEDGQFLGGDDDDSEQES